MADVQNRPRLRESIAAEIRVAMVRRQVTGAALAHALAKSQAYVSRRLSGETAFDTDDLEIIAATLRVKVADLIGHAERGDGAYTDNPATLRNAVGRLEPVPDHPIHGAVRLPSQPAIRRTAPTGARVSLTAL